MSSHAATNAALDEDVFPDPKEGIGPLAVRVIGEGGPVVVLVHGLGRVVACFDRVGAKARGYRLVLADNPGLGRSRSLKVPPTVEGHAALYAETLRCLGLPGPFHVAGLSLGGMIAIALAHELGDSAASLTIFSSSSRETGLWRLSLGAVTRMLARAVWYRSLDHRVTLPEIVRPERIALEPELWRIMDSCQRREGFSLIATMKQLLAAARFRVMAHAGALPPRRLVVVGTEDRMVPNRNSLRLAGILEAPLLLLDRAGHDLGYDCPEVMAMILSRMAAGEDPTELAQTFSSKSTNLR